MIVVRNGEKTLNTEKFYREDRREMNMENVKPLVMYQVVSVEKSNNIFTVDVKDLKKEKTIHPKELSPVSMARSGINKMSMLFENRGREYIFSVREVEFNISQEKNLFF